MNVRAQRHFDVLPLSLPPRGLRREESAAYIGVSPRLFDEMVKDGRMPAAKRINARTVWDRKRLDECFEALPDEAPAKPETPPDGDEWDFRR